MPRLTIAAGFEMGTGVYINVTAPEDAASFLRAATLPVPELDGAHAAYRRLPPSRSTQSPAQRGTACSS